VHRRFAVRRVPHELDGRAVVLGERDDVGSPVLPKYDLT
jgi:hypothetical protein